MFFLHVRDTFYEFNNSQPLTYILYNVYVPRSQDVKWCTKPQSKYSHYIFR